MDNSEKLAVLNALANINKCLDERFEENAKLYIAPSQVENLKKLIYMGNFPQLVQKCLTSKIIAPEVMVNVIVKNAWLIHSDKYSQLSEIFEACDYEYFKSIITKNIFDNKLDMSSDFRLWLLTQFLEKTDSDSCYKLLEGNFQFLNNTELRALCIYQALKDELPMKRYKSLSRYVLARKNLLTAKVLKSLFADKDFTNEVKDAIFIGFNGNDDWTNFWVDCLSADNAKYMFVKFKDFCRQNPNLVFPARNKFLPLFQLAHRHSIIPLLAKYASMGCAAMDGANKKILAEKILTSTWKRYRDDFHKELNKHGIVVTKESDLASFEEMVSILNENPTPGQYRFLVASFRGQFEKDYLNKLNQLQQEVIFETFEEFCCYLVRLTAKNMRTNMKYLVYAITELETIKDEMPSATTKSLLKHIENYDILRTCKGSEGIDKVRAFVKQKDFELFKNLI